MVRFLGKLAILLLVTVAGCQQPPAPAPAGPPTVFVATPVTQEILEYEDFTGRTEAMATVDIRARVTGYLLAANFKEGAQVKKGDILFEVDPSLYKALFKQADSQVNLNKASLALAEATHARNLAAGNAISPQERDQSKAAVDEAIARVKATEATLEIARINLEYTHVRSPIDGRISRVLVDPGNLVKTDDTLLTTVVSHDPMYVYFDMDERTLLRLGHLRPDKKVQVLQETGVPVHLALADEQGFPHQGKVDFMDVRLDPSTGTIRVRGVFPNPKHELTPGLFARVRLPIGVPHPALLVPEQALGTDQGQKFLYVINAKNEVVYRRVKVGSLVDGLRVVEEGVAPNDKIVVNGLQRIRPGDKVVAKTVEATPVNPGTTRNPAPVMTGPKPAPTH